MPAPRAIRPETTGPAHRRLVWLASVVLGAFLGNAAPAWADLRICNNTSSRVGVAIGYKDDKGWLTEGWWNVTPSSCETLLEGTLKARFYYVYAIDYDRGGEWGGRQFMCTQQKLFTIRETADCVARGFERTGFFEIDTGELATWTVQLTDPGRAGAKP